MQRPASGERFPSYVVPGICFWASPI